MHSSYLIPLFALVASLVVSGCASPPPDLHTEIVASRAIGINTDRAIVFQTNAMPDNALESPDSLTLDRVIRLSLQSSPEIQSAFARVYIAMADAKQSRLLPNPIASVGLRFRDSGKPVIDLGLTADLLAVLRRPGAVNSADARLRASSCEAINTVIETVSTVQESYFATQSLEAQINVLRERRDLLGRLLSLAESRQRLGEGTRLDVVTLQTQQVELETEVADRELDLQESRLALARQIGAPSSAANWSIPSWTAPDPVNQNERQCVELALRNRPEIQQRHWELEAFGFDLKLVDWNLWQGTEVGVTAERDGGWSVGPTASLPIPLLDMGQAQRERAQAVLIESRHQLVNIRRQVIEEVRRAHTALVSSNKNLLRVQSQLIPLQEDRLKQAEAQFKAGQTNATVLLIAEQDLRSTRAKLIELQQRVAAARLRLERAVGGSGILNNLSSTRPTTQETNRSIP